jgi:hypothetical protein
MRRQGVTLGTDNRSGAHKSVEQRHLSDLTIDPDCWSSCIEVFPLHAVATEAKPTHVNRAQGLWRTHRGEVQKGASSSIGVEKGTFPDLSGHWKTDEPVFKRLVGIEYVDSRVTFK